ncbi:MAG: GntR family transcriptional regulator [Planctomycetes bacterium]|nr:GntR family transcriptional regulator [Planctomycetota bacterium]
MIIRIDPQSAEPLFEQVVFAVKAAVAKGTAKAGDRLPSVRDLARELAINPNTVVRAYEVLERDGVIVRRQGAGCFLTGRGSDLAATERRKQLVDLLRRAATEAFHLGFPAADIEKALRQCLDEMQFAADGANKGERKKP